MIVRLITLAVFLSFGAAKDSRAESCDTDCHAQCEVDVLFGTIVEPSCHLKCEAAKKAACALGTEIPTPPSPTEIGKDVLETACGTGFQAVTNWVITTCSNWDGRLDGQQEISEAVQTLTNIGSLDPSELNGVQIRWCPLSGAHGMAPDRGRIYLDTADRGNLFMTALTLAHEMAHIRQYRRMGTDNFKCQYSQEYAACGGCQDERHDLEREAYQYENQVQAALQNYFSGGGPVSGRFPPGTDMQGCGCWGWNPSPQAPEPRCTSGWVRINQCGGFCQGGGSPYGYVCQ